MNKRFAIFILSHGRPSNVVTLQTLKRCGYTGEYYIIIDNEDKMADDYRTTFGEDKVIELDKKAISKTFDTADTQTDRRTIVYARNASQQIAKDLGYEYMLQLDDDYTSFNYRYVKDGVIKSNQIRQFDSIVEVMIKFLDDTGAKTVALSQGGDHMGGVEGNISKGLLRKAMNSLFMRTDNPINFIGRINEDVNSYVVYGSRGDLFLTVMGLQLNQIATQSNAGGMSNVYLDSGTYLKSFYTVMMAPSCVTIRAMGMTDMRLHHNIKWDKAVPKIINAKYKKPIVNRK